MSWWSLVIVPDNYSGLVNDCFTANFQETVTMKEFRKSDSIWWSYFDMFKGAVFFWTRCILKFLSCSCNTQKHSLPLLLMYATSVFVFLCKGHQNLSELVTAHWNAVAAVQHVHISEMSVVQVFLSPALLQWQICIMAWSGQNIFTGVTLNSASDLSDYWTILTLTATVTLVLYQLSESLIVRYKQ